MAESTSPSTAAAPAPAEGATPWQRRVPTTLKRLAVGGLVAGTIVFAGAWWLGVDPETVARLAPGGEFDETAEVAPVLAGMAIGFALWLASWMDHILARFGRGTVFLAVGAAWLGGAVVIPGMFALLGPAYLGLQAVALAAAYTAANGLVRDSFPGVGRNPRPF